MAKKTKEAAARLPGAAPKPFVKWAGGKAKMLPFVLAALPEKISTYYEPFVGGGAVFFELVRQQRFENAVINDSNQDLICAFQVVKSKVSELVQELRSGPYKYERSAYYRIRGDDPGKDAVKRAARFIYLNRTCFNGLYRVNKDGRFNTPFGRFTNPTICDEENLRAVSKALKKVTVRCGDFACALPERGGFPDGSAVYFDPPYLPVSKTASFTAYNAGGFSLEDHRRLRDLFSEIAEDGVRVVLSNSYSETTLSMYRGFDIREMTGARNVGGPAEYRKPVKEILVVGGPARKAGKVA